jgi:hypothetical protein
MKGTDNSVRPNTSTKPNMALFQKNGTGIITAESERAKNAPEKISPA